MAGVTIAVLAAVVLAADQISKQLALTHLVEGESVPVMGEALQWLLVFNPGAAFSMGEGVTWIFTIALALVAGAIVYIAITRVRSALWAVVLGLLLGGVLGNLTDRLVRDPGFAQGHVVDFILTPWMWFWTNPAIYNVADIFIVGGMIAVALLVVTGFNFDGTRGEQSRAAADASGDTETRNDVVDDAAEQDDAARQDDAAPGGDAVPVTRREAAARNRAGAVDPESAAAPHVGEAAGEDDARDETGERETRSGA